MYIILLKIYKIFGIRRNTGIDHSGSDGNVYGESVLISGLFYFKWKKLLFLYFFFGKVHIHVYTHVYFFFFYKIIPIKVP